MNFYKSLLLICFSILIFISCEKNVEFQLQNYFYSNLEGNNTIEGTHLYIDYKNEDTLYFDESNSKILKHINRSWVLGQGSGKPYFDTGKEYYWHILKVLPQLNAIITRPVNQYFSIKKPIVFWKTGPYPVKLSDSLKGSWGFSKIILDKKDNIFKTHLFECDTDIVNIYIATSENLTSWKINHLLQPKDFKGISWIAPNFNNEMKMTPVISDVIFDEEKYYSFTFGKDENKKTSIGLLISDSMEGKYEIIPTPIISPNDKSEFSNGDVYFPKIVKRDSFWLMFYTATNKNKDSFLCIAKSDNLIKWSVVKENILPRNKGWNSGTQNMTCAQVEITNDRIHLWVTGTKDVGDYSSPNKGNSMDICIGEFYAPLDSYKFTEAYGNPIFGGNPTFEFENDHVGKFFQKITFDNYLYTFYQGKGRKGKKHTILIR